jgi:rhodanese-related sulfurtransferase
MNKQKEIEEKYQTIKLKYLKNVKDISVESLIQIKKEKKVILIDCREVEEQEISILPNSILSRNFDKSIIKEDSVIVTYCTIGFRSGLFILDLQKEFKNIEMYNLIGGILSWTHISKDGLVNVKGEKVNKVHVYGNEWNLANDDYEIETFSFLKQNFLKLKYIF